MLRSRFLCLLLAFACMLASATPALAAQVDCDATYCFTAEDFGEDPLVGICITQLPDSHTGTVMLGNRVIRSGDILTAAQVEGMTFSPLRTQQDKDAVVTYLPIYENRVAPATAMTISIRGKEDKAPVAEDMALETYKNLPNQGTLKVSDPEGEALTYTLARKPRRGEVVINTDGTFTYTPKKNKVGIDSFTYTAADPAGNVSREATVTVQILKPTDSRQYTDTAGLDCRFAAEWMRNTGLFVGEKIGEQECFQPEKTVSRGQFLAMMVDALDIPTDKISYEELPAGTPDWLRPYLAAALRSGLTAGLPKTESGSFLSEEPITGAEAAVMLQNALDLSISRETLEVMETEGISEEIPVWAAVSLTAMSDNGIPLSNCDALTRGELAQVLYQVCQVSPTAPGTAVFRMQQ
ncbi:MAG: cadherin-like domain-containing protein [Oscillospiraceae bacterium]|nr:cadherin-like domain-containing protein [Oscillospiraceae bacterium]